MPASPPTIPDIGQSGCITITGMTAELLPSAAGVSAQPVRPGPGNTEHDGDSAGIRAPGSGRFDTTRPNIARVYDYWLGGKDNFEIDRAVGEQVRSMFPEIAQVARVQREFLARAGAGLGLCALHQLCQ